MNQTGATTKQEFAVALVRLTIEFNELICILRKIHKIHIMPIRGNLLNSMNFTIPKHSFWPFLPNTNTVFSKKKVICKGLFYISVVCLVRSNLYSYFLNEITVLIFNKLPT